MSLLLATQLRQSLRVRRRLRAAAKVPREASPAKAQAKAYQQARELEWELEPEDAEAAFFAAASASASDENDDATSSLSPCSTTMTDSDITNTATKTTTRKGILRRRSRTNSRRGSLSSPASVVEEDEGCCCATNRKANTTNVAFAPGDATDLETGEPVPAHPSGLCWRDWQIMNNSRNAREQLDAIRADAQGCLPPTDPDDPEEEALDSADEYVCTTDEENFWSEEEDGIQVSFADDGDEDGEEDERLSGSATTRNNDSEQDTWSHDCSDWDSSDSDSGGEYDADFESDEEGEGPVWEFC